MKVSQTFRSTLRRIYWTRQCLRMFVVVAAAWLFGTACTFFITQQRSGSLGAGSVENVIQEASDGLWIAIGPPAIFILMLLLLATVLRTRDVRRRDPQRRFTGYQRREGMLRAGGRCELESSHGRRCARAAEHGDHFYPWSKGGATSLRNFVGACGNCNRAKGASIPSPGLLTRLERRRATYVATQDLVRVGERHGTLQDAPAHT